MGYYDGLSPCHLSSLAAITLSLGSNETQSTYISDNGAQSLEDVPASFSRFSSSTMYSSKDRPTLIDDKLDPAHSTHILTVHGLRTQMFHRSISIADLQAGKRIQTLEPDRAGLRRVPQSTYDLRTHAQIQDQMIRDSEYRHIKAFSNSSSQYHVPNPADEVKHDEKRLRRKFQYKSYQDLHILSMYQENGSLLSLNSIRQPQSATIESSPEVLSSTESSPKSSPMPRTPTTMRWADQIPWCQKAKTDHDRMRRINARQVHVIEQKDDFDESENEIVYIPERSIPSFPLTHTQMHATVLIGPGKPRLIQIHRPKRSDHSLTQQHSNDRRTLESVTPITDSGRKQYTSSHRHTPASDETRFSDISTTSRPDTPTPMSQRCPRLSINTNLNMDFSRTSQRSPSTSSSNTMFSIDDHKTSYLPSLSSKYVRRRSSTESRNTSILDESPPRPIYASPESTEPRFSSDMLTFDRICRQRKHYQSLDAVITSTNRALDALAAREFDLISPVLQFFRVDTMTGKYHNTTDQVLITHLNKIFPQTSSSSLSTLAAWLIVDAYYTHLFNTAPPGFTSSDFTSDLYNATYSPSTSPSPPSYLPRITISAATSPTFSSRPHSRTTISSPLHPSSIPSKAKSILGIPNAPIPPRPTRVHTDPSGCNSHPFDSPPSSVRSRTSPTLLPLSPARMEEKARVVHASVQTVGRNLVGDLLVGTEKRSCIRGRLGSGRSGSGSVIGKGGVGTAGGSGCSQAQERAVNALWEACRCVAS